MWKNTFLFLPCMAIGWRLVTSGVENGGGGLSAIRAFLVSLGVTVKSLCFWFYLREVVFKLVGRPLGKTAASIPRGAKQTPGYVRSQKLIWFGEFKIQFGSCILAYQAAFVASLSWYIDHPMWGIGEQGGDFTFVLPCIAINFFLNNQPDALIIQILFYYKTLRVSGIFSAHHQEFSTVHSALVSFMPKFYKWIKLLIYIYIYICVCVCVCVRCC